MPRDSSASTIAGVRLTHPDKVLYADQGITKRDLATYLEKVAALMWPTLENRLVSFVRCPDGRHGQCFFQRHVSPGMPASFRQAELVGSGGQREKYIYLAGIEGLIATAQFGVLEIHVWGSRIDDIERPDRIVFDLDPGEGVAFADVKRAAEEMRDLLDGLGLETVPMLTGGKGIHVIVPIARRHAWPEVKAFCRAAAERLAEAAPDRFVTHMAKSRRGGRIFIDYLRNDRAATAIAPFSARARPGAPLAWPVEWGALPKVDASAAVAVADVLSGAHRPAAWSRYPARQSLKAAAFRALGVAPD